MFIKWLWSRPSLLQHYKSWRELTLTFPRPGQSLVSFVQAELCSEQWHVNKPTLIAYDSLSECRAGRVERGIRSYFQSWLNKNQSRTFLIEPLMCPRLQNLQQLKPIPSSVIKSTRLTVNDKLYVRFASTSKLHKD